MTKSFYLALAAAALLSVTAASAKDARHVRAENSYASQQDYASHGDNVVSRADAGQGYESWYEKHQADALATTF
ncbi:MAG: hypothetical protein WA792_12240 [Pseudolabrys sp.]|jgi:hypothetical protein